MKSRLITVFLAVLLSGGMLLHAANSTRIKLFEAEKTKAMKVTEPKKDMDFLLNIFLR